MSPGRDKPRLDQDPRLLLPQLRPERQANRSVRFRAIPQRGKKCAGHGPGRKLPDGQIHGRLGPIRRRKAAARPTRIERRNRGRLAAIRRNLGPQAPGTRTAGGGVRWAARPSTSGRNLRAERIHLAATLLNNAANPHDSSLTSPYFFLCSGRRLRHIKDTRSCRRQIARPRSAMVWLPRSAKIERDDRAGHGTICHLNNLD